MILVVTNRRDVTADFASAALDACAKPWFRLDTDRWPNELELELGPNQRVLIDDDRVIDLNSVTAVWWRRPVPPVVEGTDRAASVWAARESHAALDAAMRAIDAQWVNHPDANRIAQSKPNALTAAAALGLQVPSWLVTNRYEAAEAFADHYRGEIVVKPVNAGRVDAERTLYTTRLTERSILERLGPEPCLLQRFVDKVADIRVVLVGGAVYAVAIDSQADPRTLVDVRAGDLRQLAHTRVSLPSNVEKKLVSLVAGMDLRFAAVDLALDSNGTHWFLEINPNGQWAWLEELTGVPVSEALAAELAAA